MAAQTCCESQNRVDQATTIVEWDEAIEVARREVVCSPKTDPRQMLSLKEPEKAAIGGGDGTHGRFNLQ